jgi:dTDP-4-amino-4,6-dideoxygalactose transaminase
LNAYLNEEGIECSIHYPIPIHLQPAADYLNYKRGSFPETEKQSGEILSLPIHNSLSIEDVQYVSDKICEFFN